MSDTFERFREFWDQFKKDKIGIVGLCILGFSLLVVIFEPLLLPFKATNENWRNIGYWLDNPAAVPPRWTNWFTSKKGAISAKVQPETVVETNSEHGDVTHYIFSYNYKYAKAPVDLVIKMIGKSGNVSYAAELERPDGETVFLGQFQFTNIQNQTLRVSLQNDARTAVQSYMKKFGAQPTSGSAKTTELLFSKGEKNMYKAKNPLKGNYILHVYMANAFQHEIENPELIVQGAVFGVMGTDTSRRDIFSGVIAGLKWALFIGLVTSVVSVVLGLIYGVVCAYFGGRVDNIMQFIAEIFLSLPTMPILIVIFAVLEPSIWYIILVIVFVGWVGPVKTIRSMAMQIREETYVEAAKALGASHGRIIFKHIIPILLPYSFATMATSVPGYIVYEASLSMLGLGDSTIVSWGQILQDARSAGASLNGLWWWIIPPGLAISLMGMTFAFIGFSMDKILYPKLQKR